MIKGYKGFYDDFKCRSDFQYEVGGEYEEDDVVMCKKGFHFCENPLDVFRYYPPSTSRYAEVDGDGIVAKNNIDTKVVCSKIRIDKELDLFDIISAGTKRIMDHINWENKKLSTGDINFNTEYNGVATHVMPRSIAANIGHVSAAINNGYKSVAINTGDLGIATNKAHASVAINVGDNSIATNTGLRSTSANMGDHSVATNAGYRSMAANTGNRGIATNTGYRSVALSIGDDNATLNTGKESVAISMGECSTAIAEGERSTAIALGVRGKAKGALGCWIILAEHKNVFEDGCFQKDIKCAYVDGETIKANTFYQLVKGKFVEYNDKEVLS